MNSSSLVGLANNAAFLLAISLLYDISGVRPAGQKSGFRELLTGVVIGAMGIAIMANPWDFGHGIGFDTRSVLLCVAGLFFGTAPTVMAVVVTGAYRLFVGGAGVWVGVAVIATSAAIGLAWRHFRGRTDLQFSMGELYLLGIIVHLAMLAWLLILPWNVAESVLKAIGLPVMLIHPLTTALLGMLLVNRGRRHEAENKLRSSEEKYRRLAENISDVVWITDFDLRTTYVSPSVERLVGESAEVHLQRAMEEKFPPDALEKLAAVFAEEMAREKDPDCDPHRSRMLEVEHYRADGSIVWVSIHCSFVRDEKGAAVGLQGVTRDISGRKSAEETIRHSNDLMRYIIEHANSGVAVHDRDLRYVYVSQRYLDQYRVSESEVIGRHHYDVFPDLPQKWRDVHRRALAGEISRADRDPYPREDGTLEWTRWECRPWHMADGAIGGIIVYTEVITDRVRNEEKIRRFGRIFEESRDEIYLFDAQTLRFTDVNKAAQHNLGYTLDELRTMTPVDLKPEMSPETFDAIIAPLRSGDKHEIVFETLHRRKDQSHYHVEVHLQVLKYPNDELFAAIILDITERKRNEQENERLQAQLNQAQKMDSVGRLAGGVAHDYNNMLSVILGYSEMLLQTIDSSDASYKAVVEIQGAARRSADITRQLLAFARKQTIAPRVLDLNDTVQGMLTMLRRLIGEDINLAWMPGAALWPVKMDPSQMDQILANLCVNARDAIGGVGRVTIETDNARFDAADCADHSGAMAGEYVVLAVSDDGCGMDAKTLQNIFEPFFTTKPEGHGTGLGLATVYGIVKQNEGFIHVDSEPDKGTTFRIHLPRHAGQAIEDRAGPAAEPPRSRGETVLLVEDEASILRLGKQMLLSLGYDVLTSNSPEDALDRVERHERRIDMLITDVVMPAMSGRDLSDRLVARYPELKTLYMSGYTADVIAHRGVLDEGVHFIAKPFSRIDLALKLRAVLNNEVE